MIPNRPTIRQYDLIQLFCDKHNVSWNDACAEIGDEEFLGRRYISDVQEMVKEEPEQKAWPLILEQMTKAGVKELWII